MTTFSTKKNDKKSENKKLNTVIYLQTSNLWMERDEQKVLKYFQTVNSKFITSQTVTT